MKNKLFVIEGTDGSGKRTQSKLLVERLKNMGVNCVMQSFPDYPSPACAPVKMYLNGEFGDSHSLTAYQANALYAVDRLCTMQKYKEHISGGGSIVFDRYVQSTMLHQAGLIDDLKERDKFLEYVDEFEFNTLKLPRPDVVLFLDVPVEVTKELMAKREEYKSGNKKDIYEEDVQHLYNAYSAGKYVANKYGWTIIDCVKDGQILPIEEISDKIFNAIMDKE